MQHIEIDESYGSASGYVIGSGKVQAENYLSEYTPEAKRIADWLKKNCSYVALLKNINVAEGERGKGYGTDLYSEFMDEAEGYGAETVILISDSAEVQEEGFDLARWYEDNGFIRVVETGCGPVMVYPEEIGERMVGDLFPERNKR